jgi:F-type H+-transporting ATPase subunit b
MVAFIYQSLIFLAEAGHSGEGGGFLKFYNDYLNIPGFEAWKFLNLAIFIGILIYLLKKPLSEAFQVKRDAIRAELIKAEEEKQAALRRLADVQAKLASLESDVQAILKRANDEAAEDKDRLTEQTEFEIKRLRDQVNSEISRIAHQSRAELRKFSAEESVRLAEEKLRAQIDSARDSMLVRANINAIGGLN